MSDYLKSFTAGESIKASETNSNNQYLLDKISDNSSEVQAYIATQISSITSQFETFKEEIQTQLDALEKSLSSEISGVPEDIAPKYSSSTTLSSGWTATKYGWVNWVPNNTSSNSKTSYLYINGVEVGYHTHYKYGQPNRFQFFVSKGDVVKFSGADAKFFPCKGA